MSKISNNLIIALRATVVTLVLTGLVYPLAVTGLAQVIFPARADGSLVKDESGNIVGSELLGQGFSNAAYFQSRPSAAGNGWDAAARVAKARGIETDRVRRVVEAQTEGRDLRVLGEPCVNVLMLNLALDRQFGRTSSVQVGR